MKTTLRVHRINKGLSIEDAASKLGIKVDELRKYELYTKCPSNKMIIKMMQLYGIGYIDEIIFCNKAQVIEHLKQRRKKEKENEG